MWELKKTEDGGVAFGEDGHLILVSEDGKEERSHNAVDSQEHSNKLRKENQASKDRFKAQGKEHAEAIAAFEAEKTELVSKLNEYKDVIDDPTAAKQALETVAGLGDDAAAREASLNALKREHQSKVEEVRLSFEGDGGTLTAANKEIERLMKSLVQQRFLPAWVASDVLNGWKITPTVNGVTAEFGHLIQEDGTVLGHDGAKLMAFEVGEGEDAQSDMPATDPIKIIKHLCETHPQRDALRLSKLPVGSGVDDGGGKSDLDKFFDPESRDFNPTEQMNIYRAQPHDYDRLMQKYKKKP